MNIKLEQYKIFNEAASTLSFSLAAKNLFISQSAVSQTILSLEKQLNTKLFIRQAKGVTLTHEGSLLHKKINEALSLITSAENDLISSKELETGELIIGAGDTLCENFLLPLLVQFRKMYPHIKINVINRTSLETIQLIKNGQIDLGLINLPVYDESLEIKNCFEVHDIFVSSTPPSHPYTYQQISKENLILLEKSSNSRNYIDQYFASHGIILHPEMELGAHELLLEFAKEGLGISCVIQEFSKDLLEQKKLFPIPLEKSIPSRHIGYAYLKRKSLSLASLKFIELINKYDSTNETLI